MNDTNKEFRIARDEGKFIVAPDWVWMCRDEGKRIDESLFPHVHNPKMSLSIISTKSSPVKGRKKGRKKKMEGMVMESQFEEDCEDDVEGGEDEQRNRTIVQNINKETADKSRESLAKELEELENLAAVTIGGQRKSFNSSTRSKSLRDADTLKNKPSRSPSTQQRQTGNTETESQNTAITWDDPQEREARARLEVALVGDTEDILARRQVEEIYNEDKENSTKEANISSNTAHSESVEESPKYIIALSGMSDEDKEKYTNIVNCLRGSTIDGKHFDPSITHIISQKPSRSEKHLAAIASGKWILYRSFLDFSEKAGHFVEEAPHEWGNPSARLLPPLPEESTEGKLSFAAHRWRIHFGEKGYGAFHNMKVMFYSSKERVAAFTRLIEAGGGEVIKDLDYVDEVTHCFVEMNKAPKTDLAIFASRNIPCLPPMYLNEFLINYPPPDEMESCIQEYKDILNNMTISDISRISRK
ncbi:DNA topoisomerase 2-binding protein 1 [Armadillidium vulgare]|nr:DNA topoisomerase 2-binding protein 1 [Armadillidium vulgare]